MIAAILVLVGCMAGGGDEPASEQRPTPSAEAPVAVGEMPGTVIAAGGEAAVPIPVQVADGHRVQANPASSEFLVPLELRLTVDEADGLTFGAPVYPEGLPYRLEGTDEDLSTYVGHFEIVVPVRVTGDAAPGPRSATAELHYQACNTWTCLFPAKLDLTLEVVVE